MECTRTNKDETNMSEGQPMCGLYIFIKANSGSKQGNKVFGLISTLT